MATPRPGRTRALTPELARERLVAKGMFSLELDALTELLRGVKKGEYIYPASSRQAFNPPKAGVLRIARRMEKLAKDLDRLWTPKGQRLIRDEQRDSEHNAKHIRLGAIASLPDQLRVSTAILLGMLNDGGKRLPATKKGIKLEIIRLTKEATNSWHDAELAALFGEKTENWKSWRKKWCKPPHTSQ